MTREEIFNFINENPVFYLGTSDNNVPHVRAMRLFSADEHGIVFNTSRSKTLHKHLLENPNVELCFYNDVQGVQVRIRGKAMHVNGTNLKAKVAGKAPVLASAILRDDLNSLEVYNLTEARANVWEMDSDYTPKMMSNAEVSSVWMAMYNGAHKVHA